MPLREREDHFATVLNELKLQSLLVDEEIPSPRETGNLKNTEKC